MLGWKGQKGCTTRLTGWWTSLDGLPAELLFWACPSGRTPNLSSNRDSASCYWEHGVPGLANKKRVGT